MHVMSGVLQLHLLVFKQEHLINVNKPGGGGGGGAVVELLQ